MDPATAFSLVASIITIIQVGIKTASEVKDVYQSETGAQKRNNVLEQTANKLDSTCGQLRSCLSSTQDGQRLSPAESELRDIALKCTGSAKKLNDLLEKLKAKPRKRDALFKTIKAKWKQNEVDELQREVDEYQKALNTRMLTDLRLELSETQFQKQKSAFSEAKVLRDALWFPQMHHRHQQITEAYPGTFHWIFRHAKEAEKAWDCFVCWLQNGEGLYWINGKAGSGKSTLMNYTSYDPKTQGYLKAWSGDTSLIIAKVFFWNSGSALEKSQQGLLRTLLYQVLKESPELASTLFPSCQSAQMASLRDADSRDSYWTEKELLSALEQLVSVSSISQRFCFFIDGLDEFDGDYELLVSLLQRLCSAQHIKICVASRPVPAFKDAFADSPSLELQDLTAVDMREYVSKRLERNPRGKKPAIDEANSYSSLVEDILRKASGVFLWVRLVVDRLLKDLDNRDTIKFLRARLDELPGDLTQLFRSMMGSFDPKHQEEAARSFRTVFAAPNPRNLRLKFAPSLSILDLFFAEEATVASALTHSGGKTDWKQLETR